MNSYEHMFALLKRNHASGSDGERLANEMLVSGYNVLRDFIAREVGEPWVMTSKLENFYRVSDSFIYELLVWHHTPNRIQERTELTSCLNFLFRDGARVLCVGDGISYDSCAIALHSPDFQVVSSEFESPSTVFAGRLIDDLGLGRRVDMVHDPSTLKRGHFDAVVCFDVIEHVPIPQDLLCDLASYLKPGGYAFITEAFGSVEPLRPTHLLSNLKYTGQLIRLCRGCGLSFQKILGARIHVFIKNPPAWPPGRQESVHLLRGLWRALRAQQNFQRFRCMGRVELERSVLTEVANPSAACTP